MEKDDSSTVGVFWISHYDSDPQESKSLLNEVDSTTWTPSRELVKHLLALDRVKCRKLAEETPLDDLADTLLVPALEHVGAEWAEGRLSLAQVYMSGRICEELFDALLPQASIADGPTTKIAITTLDDHHLLGKRLVRSVLLAAGMRHTDLGRLDVDSLVERVMNDGVELLLVSTLMLSSALHVEELKTKLEKRDAATKIIVGGAPFRLDPSLWKQVGADAAGRSAVDAVDIVRRLRGGDS